MTRFLFAILPFMVCSMWALHLLLDYLLNRSAVTFRLLVFCLTAVVLYAGHAVFFLHFNNLIPVTDTLYGMANLAVYPMYFLYIVQLTQGRLLPRHWLTLLPSVLCGVLYAVLYACMDEAETLDFIEKYIYQESFTQMSSIGVALAWTHQFFKLVFLWNVMLIGWLGFKHLHNFEHRMAQMYADLEGRTLRPVHVMLMVFVFASLLSSVSIVVGRQFFQESVSLLAIPSVVFSIMLYLVCYIGSRSMFSFADFQAEHRQEIHDDLDEAVETDEEMTSKIALLARQIEELMTKEEFYLKPDLRVSDVAEKLGTNVKYISMAFNRVIGATFSDYVNCRRISHANELHHHQPNLSMTEVAHRSGYDSMQSFYRNQKKWGGVNNSSSNESINS